MENSQSAPNVESDEQMLEKMASHVARQESNYSGTGMALFEDEEKRTPLLTSYLRTFVTPGPVEREKSELANAKAGGAKRRKANLDLRLPQGTLVGVYLPTIQHIFGVIMFLRLYWVVGVMGIGQSTLMVFMCCVTTFLTSISMSAIATNGVVESGGSYFMISRNLGPEFGSAVGVLFYLANAVATSMYLVGSVEILLIYVVPFLKIGGGEGAGGEGETALFGVMTNNFRLYATILLLVEVALVACGVRFVQLFAPVSLSCVIISVLAIYIGFITRSIWPESGPRLCMLGDTTLRQSAFMPAGASSDSVCDYCESANTTTLLREAMCSGLNGTEFDACLSGFVNNWGQTKCVLGIPGLASSALVDNFDSNYMKLGEAAPGKQANKQVQVFQDITTNFFVVLAIYFPSVTGIMTGSNMSGDLRDPQKSIPSGTIAAQLTTSFVYLSLTILFGCTIHRGLITDKYGESIGAGMVVAQLAWPSHWVLLIGSFTSTFGAALQCLCSAPRLLQSIAKDNVIPFLAPFAVVDSRNEPIRGLLITAVIAELAILIGLLDYIAPVVDFFFLMCYAFVNIITALHSLLGAPNWRPRFRYYHWFLSLMGAALCFFIMFTTHWNYALVVIILCLGIYKYVEYKGAKKEWGDGIRGLALSTAQYSLLKVDDKDPHPKNWRPQLLVFVKPPLDGNVDLKRTEGETSQKRALYRTNMLNLAGQLKAGRGLTMVVGLIPGDPANSANRDEAALIKEAMWRDMTLAKVKGFCKTVMYDKDQFHTTAGTLLQSAGIDKIHRGASMDMCLIVAKGVQNFPGPVQREHGFIDVWWVLHDGGLLILIGFLLRQHKVWRGCRLRLFAVAQETDNSVKMKEDLQNFMYQLRIDADVKVIEFAEPEISAYAYERTLAMEERNKYIRQLSLSHKEKRNMSGVGELARKISSRLAISVSHPHVVDEDDSLSRLASVLEATDPQLLVEKHRGYSKPILRPPSESDDAKQASDASPPEVVVHGSTPEPDSGDTQNGAAKTGQQSPEAQTPSTPNSAPAATTPVEAKKSRPRFQIAAVNERQDSVLEREKELLEVGDELPELRRPSFGERDGTPGVSDSRYQFTFTPQTAAKMNPALLKAIDKRKVKKMHTAVRLNEQIQMYSADSRLVILNLPKPPRSRVGLENYIEYMEVLTDNLDRVLLVRGTGKEVVTIYS